MSAPRGHVQFADIKSRLVTEFISENADFISVYERKAGFLLEEHYRPEMGMASVFNLMQVLVDFNGEPITFEQSINLHPRDLFKIIKVFNK